MEILEEPDGNVRRYWVYGLIMDSELPFPELVERETDGTAPDVVLRFGEIDLKSKDWRPIGKNYFYAADAFLAIISENCSFVAEHAGRITIQQYHKSNLTELRTFVLGAALTVIHQQRGNFTFHVSAVETPMGAWAFTGPSGAGKSTSAALISRQYGWPLITDDVAIISVENEVAKISGGVTKAKLWTDSIQMLGFDSSHGHIDPVRTNKYHFFLSESYISETVGLTRLYLLEPETNAFEPIKVVGMEKIDQLAQAVFGKTTLPYFLSGSTGYVKLMKIADKVEMYKCGHLNEKLLAKMCEELPNHKA